MQAGADRELIEASRSGDRAAFARLIERHQRAVYAVAFSATRDRSLADDVTQDAFVTAWRRLAELRDPDRLPAWLCGIARNVARDARKRRRGEVHEDIDDIAGETTPYDAMTDAECERIVSAALGEMPDVYREPLVLFYYEERSVEDVARYLGISAATTHKRLSRGRQYLADRVATLVERGIVRRGARVTLAASVLALIGVTLPASPVDASPLRKGSTMHKLAIAGTLAALVAGGTIAVVATTRTTDTQASSSSHAQTAAPVTTTTQPAAPSSLAHATAAAMPPSLPDLFHAHRAHRAAVPAIVDCATAGKHLAELEHIAGTGDDPARSAAEYADKCGRESWSIERRACTVAANDLMNAHLCAFAGSAADADVPIPASLACPVIAAHITPVVQGAGMFHDVPDFAQQIEDACDAGAWPVALRQCFVAAQDVDALHACLQPPAE